MARIATLWPAGIRSAVVTPSATAMPGGRLERAISTPSFSCRRMTGGGVMGYLLGFYSHLSPQERGKRRIKLRLAVRLAAGLADLHPGIGRHQPTVVEQRHEPKAHVDR